jgi:hypothetical protein
MTTPSADEQSTITPAGEGTDHTDVPLSEEQLAQVAGAAGPVVDCEGHAYLTSNILGSKTTAKIKQPE